MNQPATWLPPLDPVTVELNVNDSRVTCTVEPRHTLADALRDAGLTGTHLGCEHGVCGACTVLLDGLPVRACLVLAVQAQSSRIQTVEGLADHPEPDGGDERHVRLSDVQRAFRDGGALQCGFCTPGFLMLAHGLLDDEPNASAERVTEVLSSNICRCTGGVPIVAAVRAAQRARKEAGA
ncbi:(2Fe-2S)-binding protein [Streptomyces sp. 184]|uniref:(2Fe-2S)-binding protein n=1 Tax=Streptomyces sp. 184 TaxID=1827526 RepID=UPI0038925B9A